MHTVKHFYKNVFSLCNILVTLVIDTIVKHRLQYLKHFRRAVCHSVGLWGQPQVPSRAGILLMLEKWRRRKHWRWCLTLHCLRRKFCKSSSLIFLGHGYGMCKQLRNHIEPDFEAFSQEDPRKKQMLEAGWAGALFTYLLSQTLPGSLKHLSLQSWEGKCL